MLVQGGGLICGSLDVVGAAITVNDCAPANDDCVNAFPLAVNLASNCPALATAGNNFYATTDGADAGCDDPGADLLDVWYTFNAGANTTVAINFDAGTMEDWALSILDGCAGNELLCLIQPAGPIDFATDPETDYIVRIHSNLTYGNGGEFSICITGDVPTVICDGGSVQTSDGFFSVDVCQDAFADVIDFATTSAAAENYTFLLTDDSNIIVAQLAGGSLDFNSAALGVYHVWGISHNGDLVGADPGLLATEVTSSGTCIDFSDNFVEVNVEICFGLTEVSNVAWSIFPNPTNGDFTLTYSGPDAFTTLEVLDMEGRMVHRQSSSMSNGQKLVVGLSGSLAMGVYTVRLSNAVGNGAFRLVVR
ncbi:MAG: T9SS type A sorting domain-containing protein [Flavobacteriales bacterium]|nr:T9SS type A sorting domain-containing protein [Flavobacteriales bacterium]